MTDQTTTKTSEQMSLDELKAAIIKAVTAGDMSLATKLSSAAKGKQQEAQKAEQEAKQKALAGITAEVKSAIDAVVERFKQAGKLDKVDGVWYTMCIGDKLTTCTLTKPVKKVASTSGGKKDMTKTSEYIAKVADVKVPNRMAHDGKTPHKFNGLTFKQASEKFTDQNDQFQLRQLAKAHLGIK